jgi:hypothetical protein
MEEEEEEFADEPCTTLEKVRCLLCRSFQIYTFLGFVSQGLSG